MKKTDWVQAYLPGFEPLRTPAGLAETEAVKLAQIRRMMELHRHEELEIRRREARHLVYSNWGSQYGRPWTVCADDIREVMQIGRLSRRCKDSFRNNLNGQIFKGAGWRRLEGFVKSKTDGSHGNEIGLYTLPEYEDAARAALAKT